MEDGVEIINGQRFVQRFIAERSDPYFLQIQRACEEHEAARLEKEAQAVAEIEAARLTAEAQAARTAWHVVDCDTYEQSIEPTATGLRIHGLATTPTITSNKAASHSASMTATLPIPLLSEHKGQGSKPIGEVYHLRKSPSGIYMRAALFDHFAAQYAEKLIRDGELQDLSISHSGTSLLAEVDGIQFWSDCTLNEISVCRCGANPDCHFEIYRDGDDGRKYWKPSEDGKRPEPRLPYRGPWKADQEYLPGDMCSHQGGLWHAEIESKGLRPNESPLGWRLVVKRGAVDKMEKTYDNAQA